MYVHKTIIFTGNIIIFTLSQQSLKMGRFEDEKRAKFRFFFPMLAGSHYELNVELNF